MQLGREPLRRFREEQFEERPSPISHWQPEKKLFREKKRADLHHTLFLRLPVTVPSILVLRASLNHLTHHPPALSVEEG